MKKTKMGRRRRCLDFETTGLKAGCHEPIQVGAVILDEQLAEVAAFESLIRPLFPAHAKQSALADSVGVRETSHGKVGYQARRTITHSAAAVRELAPAIVQFCVSEAVNKAALEKHAKAAIKTGHLPPGVLEVLEARAEVKETKAWICQPAMPAAVLDEVF